MSRFKRIVILTGAGISAESGIATFRDKGGIYEELAQADLFVSIGTSGNVYPASGFVAEAGRAGAHTVELNLEPSEGATLFHEAHHGPGTRVVPMYVERILSGKA